MHRTHLISQIYRNYMYTSIVYDLNRSHTTRALAERVCTLAVYSGRDTRHDVRNAWIRTGILLSSSGIFFRRFLLITTTPPRWRCREFTPRSWRHGWQRTALCIICIHAPAEVESEFRRVRVRVRGARWPVWYFYVEITARKSRGLNLCIAQEKRS